MPDQKKYLVFAGAGVSMISPTSLPSWWAFNEVVLNALAEQLATYTSESEGRAVLGTLNQQREGSTTFAPDYMADIIAEECGDQYFQVLQALDTDAHNSCHAVVAEMAASGFCSAVVTTNFDRLFERAFDARGVPYEVYCSPDQFENLPDAIDSDCPTPIIKVHGSVEYPETMVDTLSQRLRRRPVALENALLQLYARNHLLIFGFSGADLDYDPNYLGLCKAAKENRGFTFLALANTKVKPSIIELKEKWGKKAVIVEGKLPEWIIGWAASNGVQIDNLPDDSVEVDRLPRLREHASKWAESLETIQATNILVSLLRASGRDAQAGKLFRRLRRFFFSVNQQFQPSYSRFNHLLTRYLLEYSYSIGNDDNVIQFAFRSWNAGNGAAGSELAMCYALFGLDVEYAIELSLNVFEIACEIKHPLSIIDAAIAGGVVWSIGSKWSVGLEKLRFAEELAQMLGLAHKRAQLLAHIVRFLAWKESPDEAEEAYIEGRKLAKRLGLERASLQLESAWGYALFEQRRYNEGVEILLPVCAKLEKSGRKADLTRAGLDLSYVASRVGDGKLVERSFDILEEHEIGYTPHVGLAYSNSLYLSNDLEGAKNCARVALEKAKQTKNQAAVEMAQGFIKTICYELQ